MVTPMGDRGDDSGSGSGFPSEPAPPSDADRFTEVYGACLPAIRSYLYRRVDAGVVDDLTSDVFAVAWKKRDAVTPGEELPWLYRIARYTVANHRRKQKKAFDLLAYFTIPDTSPAADTFVHHDPELAAAWNQLKPNWREALVLVVIEDMSVADAARILDVSPNTVSIRLHRAKKHLAQNLSDDSSSEIS